MGQYPIERVYQHLLLAAMHLSMKHQLRLRHQCSPFPQRPLYLKRVRLMRQCLMHQLFRRQQH
jgi:hypothetical protein